ncbi:hypothetical protein V8C44DRAFT_329801 [Trichoderma aethiopicum]
MLENSRIYLHFLLIAWLATPVTASWWDDFTNNLATDLTPLIALFGEQATKQFLSESTTFLDNFIFAMAPLGILTGVVSAIRVCGSPSLRAFIGRAQEGGGIAEAELCSSTSRDVCELYHNGAIVRVFGRPKILEIVHDPVLEANEAGNSAVPDDKREYGISISRHYFQRTILNDNRWQEKGLDASDDEAKSGQPSFKTMSNNFAPNPNLSLNIGIVKRSSYVYIMAATFGFLAQVSVIVLAAIVKYTLKWKKNENTIDPWAFPFVLAGTICVCLGMYLCATLVNDSTKERVFERKDDLSSQNASPSPTLYVVQPGNQVVGDQTFDPFLIFKPTNSYITSWKAPSSANSISETRSSTTSRRKMPSLRSMRRPSEEISVLIATLITTLGFALQFVGLRAMHSIVSLLQLAVTIAMSFVRALLRTQRLKIEANILRDRPDEVSSHELDWLALQIGKDAKEPRCSWSVVAQVPSDALRQASDDKAWEYRCRLAKLTEQPANGNSKLSNAWGNDLVSGRLQAQQLKKAIEDSMSTFIAHAKTKGDLGSMETISWALNVAVGKVDKTDCQAPTYQSLNISLRKQGSLWTVDQSLLEAVIGLWSWSIISDPLTEGETFGFKTSTASDIPIHRAVAAGNESQVQQAWTEIQFWIGEPNVTLSSFAMENPSSNMANAATIWNQGKDGELKALDDDNSSNPGLIFGKSYPYQRIFGWHGIDTPNSSTIGAISVKSKHIPTLCAQDIYQSFLCAITEHFELEKVTATVNREDKTMRLEHPLVTRLTECFAGSGVGSRQDAFLIIIPALQNNSLLPQATEAVPTAYRIAESLRKNNSYREAERVLRWAWGIVSDSGELQEIAMIELGELYRYALFSEHWQGIGEQGIDWMRLQRGPSGSHLADEVIDRYVSLQKRPRESRTGQHVLEAILGHQREETLWSISQLEKGDDFPIDESSGRSVLSLLSQKGWFELVRAVLEVGSVVDSVDSQGRTPLSYAAQYGHLSIVRLLMEANALPITEDSSRRTPLLYAAAEGHVSVIEKLLSDSRVSVYSKDTNFRSPLHWAAVNGHNGAIECLADKGARVDDVDSNHHTPLIAALCSYRRRKVDRRRTADLLVQLKSKVNSMIQNKEAWVWALENAEFACAEYLLEQNEVKLNMSIVVRIARYKIRRLRLDNLWRQLDLSTPNSQLGFRTRFLDESGNEKEVTLEDTMFVAANECAMTVRYSWDGLMERELVCESGSKIVSTLLDCLQQQVAEIEKLLAAAARNYKTGEEITSIVFEHWQTRNRTPIKITKGLAEAITQRRKNEELWRVYLQQPEENIHILMAAAPVVAREFGVEGMAAFFGRLEGPITAELLGYFDSREPHAHDIMLLLDRSPTNILITEEGACRIASNFNAAVMARLLSRHGGDVNVTQNVLDAAAANEQAGRDVTAILLNQQQAQVKVTEGTLKAAAANPNGRGVIELLLDRRGDEVQITGEFLKTAASSQNGHDKFKLLLDRRGDEVLITEELLKAAASGWNGEDIFKLLLDRRGDEVRITEEVLKVAASKSYGILELLLDRRGDEVQITEEVLKVAASKSYGILELLLDRRGDEVQITEELLKAVAVSCYGRDIFTLLLDRRGDEVRITEEVLKAVALGYETESLFKLLFDRRGDEAKITEEVLKAVVGNSWDGHGVLKLLLERRGHQVRITEGVVTAAAGNEYRAREVLELLFDKCGDQVYVTDAVVKAIVDNERVNREELIELLLDRLGERFQATGEMLEALPAEWTVIRQRIASILEHQNGKRQG